MENSYIINGGTPLIGKITLSGAKNIALKSIIAALLFEGKVVLENIPRINDVDELLHTIGLLGAKYEFTGPNRLEIDPSGLSGNKVDFLHASKIRVSFMLFAPLLYHFGECYIPNPGGCRLGARSIDRVVDGLQHLGVDVLYDHGSGYYHARLKNKIRGNYQFAKPSHTATELLILMSVFADGKVIIENAGQEPEIDDLMGFLNESGAKISRQGKNVEIYGTNKLVQAKPYAIACDRNEAVTYAIMGLATKGNVELGPMPEKMISEFINKVKLAGSGVENLGNGWWRFFYDGPFKAVDIETQPHPGFMTDWQPPWAMLMTQAKGEAVIVERIFSNRFAYVDELKKLGAEIEFIPFNPPDPENFYYFNYDPDQEYHQAVKISGGNQMHGGVLTVADLRAGATLAAAALAVTGESVVNGISLLERGYEQFIQKVSSLGGKIKKI